MPGAFTVRALRGATTVDRDSPEEIAERVHELIGELMKRNELLIEDIISALFTTTPDVVSMFPATAARDVGFGAVPMMCASEIAVPGSLPHCIRALLHVQTSLERHELRHVYLHGAQVLRDDLPG
jgi:chorismate mutase